MAHEEIVRTVEGADTAVLFMHGICGSPIHFDTVLPMVDCVQENWSVYALRYPGHGGTADDFAASSMKQWRDYAGEVFRKLAQTHERIILVGHSMGNLFAMQLAADHPQKIPFVFMLAVPMRPWPSLTAVINLSKMGFGKLNMDDPVEASYIRACGIRTTRKLWKYIGWVPRIVELFREAYKTEKRMGEISVPLVAIQSRKDEMVSSRTLTVLRKNGIHDVILLPDSTHFYYAPEDKKQVLREFSSRIEGLNISKAGS